MGLAEARALLRHAPSEGSEAAIERLDEPRDLAALRTLAAWAQRFAPIVALDPPDGLLLDVTGCAPVFRGERALVLGLVRGVARMGVTAWAGVADTAGCAWAVARYAQGETQGDALEDAIAAVEPGRAREALAPLPVAALRIEPAAVETLEEVGVDRVEPLLALPRQELAVRFGAALLRRLDEATGLASEALDPFHPRPALRVERAFAGPVRSLEGVLAAARRLLDDLVECLRAAALGALAVEVVLDRSDAPPVRLVRSLSRRSSDERHLWALLRPALETANLGFGVDRLTLTATRTGPCRAAPRSLGLAPSLRPQDDEEPQRDVAELLDAIAGRLGDARVFRVEPVESHVPETAFRRVAVVGTSERAWAAPPRAGRVEGVTPFDRPSLLLAPPEPVERESGVEDEGPAAPPPRFRWRAETHEVADVRGPERIAARWWEHAGDATFPSGVRDYFVVTTRRGRRLWLFLETATGRWLVHGEWA